MTPAELIGSLQRRGILLVPATDGRLRFRPQEALSEPERAALTRHREAILALFDADPIGWRVAVMATQICVARALPLLLARPGIRFPLGSCCSCGDPLGPDDRYRCSPCVAAVTAVLETVEWSWRAA
jgi:hypothetical protein